MEKPVDPAPRPDWADFTQANYQRLLSLAMQSYRLRPLADFAGERGAAVWRHDVDASPQRALAMAKLEEAAGVRSTYYFNMRSEFYNLFEAAVADIVTQVSRLGHEIGIHFDAARADLSSAADLEQRLQVERRIFSSELGVEARSFSFHNPNAQTANFTGAEYAGLVNAYGATLMASAAYCSDSNGYWRYKPLEDVLRAGHESVYILTHPEWWQDAPMSPRERIVRCVQGRAAATLERYDALLADNNRKNLR